MNPKQLTLRAAEITAQLAELKRAFFVDGIEKPMSVRVSLEAELANVRLTQIQLKEAQSARAMQVRQLRGEILKQRLIELGFPNLIEECNTAAEIRWQEANEGVAA